MRSVKLALTLLLGICVGMSNAGAQIHVEGVLLTEELAPRYIRVQMAGMGRMRPLDVDYGSPNRPLVGSTRLTDANGEALLFRSLIAALNYLHLRGWELPTLMDAIPPSLQEEGVLLVRRPGDPRG